MDNHVAFENVQMNLALPTLHLYFHELTAVSKKKKQAKYSKKGKQILEGIISLKTSTISFLQHVRLQQTNSTLRFKTLLDLFSHQLGT